MLWQSLVLISLVLFGNFTNQVGAFGFKEERRKIVETFGHLAQCEEKG